jgi:phage-related protein
LQLKAELQRFIEVHNEHSAKPFKWTKPAGNIIAAVGRAKRALHN